MGRSKNLSKSNDNGSNTRKNLNFKGKYIVILGIVMAVIGFTGAIYYGSLFVKEEVNGGARLPYTTAPQIKNLSPIGLEIAFVVIAIVGFGILTFEFAGRVDKPPDFYPK